MNDTSMSAEERALAETANVMASEDMIKYKAEEERVQIIIDDAHAQLADQKLRYEEYTEKLQEAADIRAAADLAE